MSFTPIPNPLPVSGPVTDAQLRATAVPVSGPLTDTQLRATAVPVSGPLTDAQLRATAVQVANTEAAPIYTAFSNTPALDAFHRLRVSESHTLFDSQTEYGLDTLFSWDIAANGATPGILSPNGAVTSGGNSVGPRDANTRLTPVTCSSTNGHYSVLQSRTYMRYVPGFSHLVNMTGIFATNATYAASIVLRTGTSGSPSDARAIAQADWNIDKFDGAGMSGITLDLTKTQILYIAAQWLGEGVVTVGFDINGRIWPAHEFLNANVMALPYSQTFNLPVRMDVRTAGSTTIARTGYFDSNNGVFLQTTNNTAGGTIYLGCASVQSEGAPVPRGIPRSQNPGTAAISVTTRRPIFSIRPSALYQGLTNRGHIEVSDFWITAGTNSSIYEIVAGGILGGAVWQGVGTAETAGAFVTGIRYKILTVGTTNFTLIGAASNTVGVTFTATGAGAGTGTAVPEYSCAEYDISATTITSGIPIITGEVISGAGATRGFATAGIDFRAALTLSQIDALAANRLPISLVCTSVSGTSSIRGGINWHEKTI